MTAAYKHIAVDESFITKYMEYMDGSETPYSFDFWSAVYLVACVLRRRVYVNRPASPVWPNCYILLVAPPGVARKSTAVIKATEMLSWMMQSMPNMTTSVSIFNGSLTPLMLTEEMAAQTLVSGSASIILALPELSRSFARNAAKSTVSYLTDMFDTKEYESGGTQVRGKYEIKKASINLLAASTPEWLGSFGSRDAVAGGFASRCIYVREDRPKRRIKWGEVSATTTPELAREWLGRIEQRLGVLEKHHGGNEVPIQATKAAIEIYEDWRDRQNTDAVVEDASRIRRERHILATACILACADLTFEIQHYHITQAIKAVSLVYDKVDEKQPVQVEKGVRIGDHDEAPILTTASEEKEIARHRTFGRLIELLREAGQLGINQHRLATRMAHLCDRATVKLALLILKDYRCVQQFSLRDGEKKGRPPTVWRATYLIDSPALEHARKLFVGQPITANEMGQGLQEPLPNPSQRH